MSLAALVTQAQSAYGTAQSGAGFLADLNKTLGVSTFAADLAKTLGFGSPAPVSSPAAPASTSRRSPATGIPAGPISGDSGASNFIPEDVPDNSLELRGGGDPNAAFRIMGFLSPRPKFFPTPTPGDTNNFTDNRQISTVGDTIKGGDITPAGVQLTIAAAQGKASLQRSQLAAAAPLPEVAAAVNRTVNWLTPFLVLIGLAVVLTFFLRRK